MSVTLGSGGKRRFGVRVEQFMSLGCVRSSLVAYRWTASSTGLIPNIDIITSNIISPIPTNGWVVLNAKYWAENVPPIPFPSDEQELRPDDRETV